MYLSSIHRRNSTTDHASHKLKKKKDYLCWCVCEYSLW